MNVSLPGVLVRPRQPRLSWPFSAERTILAGAGLVIAYLALAPLGMLLFASFKSTADRLPFEAGPLTLQNYVRVVLSLQTYRLLGTTLGYAAGSLIVAMTIAGLSAWLLERTNIPCRSVLSVLLLAPLAVPPMMMAITYILLASPSIGLVNVVLRSVLHLGGNTGPLSIYSLPGMILVGGITMVPSVYLMLSGAVRNMDPALEESGAVAGATGWRTLVTITLPLLRPALLAASAYFLVVMVEAFEIPALLGTTAGIQVFSTRIYQAAHPASGLPDYGLASGYGVVLLGLAAVLILSYQRVVRRSERFATVGAKGYRPRTIDLGRWRHVALALVLFYLMWALVLPLLILVWASLLDFYSPPSLQALTRVNLANYSHLLAYPNLDAALRNTVLAAVLAATITMLLASISAWMSVRGQFHLHRLPDALSFFTLGVPGIVLGLALIFLYLSLPLPIYGTVLILVVAYVTRFLSYGSRVMVAAQVQLQRELEEAGKMSGGSWPQVFRRIVLGLLLPPFTNGLLWVGIHVVRDVSLALMLYTHGNEMLSVIIWNAWQERAEIGLAAAFGMLLIAFSAIVTLLGRAYAARQWAQYSSPTSVREAV